MIEVFNRHEKKFLIDAETYQNIKSKLLDCMEYDSHNRSGGTVLVNGPTARMNGALDYNGSFEISGGLLIAAGSAGMAQAPSEQSS